MVFCFYFLLFQKNNSLQYRSKVSWHSETWPSRLDPRATMLKTFENRVSSLEDRETRLSRICKNSKGFWGNYLFLEGRIIQYCSHLQSVTYSVLRRSLSRENFRPQDSGLTLTFQAETTKCRPAVDDGNLPVNADNLLHSEPFHFAKLLK